MMGRRITPLKDALQSVRISSDKRDVLESKFISQYKGYGVFALKYISKGDFVVEYRGELISSKDSQQRRGIYTSEEMVYMFDFKWQEKTWTIDASKDNRSLGRLVNDDHISPNCMMKKVFVDGSPHLCLFAIRDIQPGDEITYDYGDSAWPWRTKLINESSPAPTTSHGKGKYSIDPTANDQACKASELIINESSSVPTTSHGKGKYSLDPTANDQARKASELIINESSSAPTTSHGKRKYSLDQTANDQTRKASELVLDEFKPSQAKISRYNPSISISKQKTIEDNEEVSSDMDCSDNTDYDDVDYVPDTSDSSTESSFSSKQYSTSPKPYPKKKIISFPKSQLEQESYENVGRSSTAHDESTYVASMPNSKNSWRYNKKQFCYFCEKPYSKISRHLEFVHSNESEVAKAFSFPKNSKERRVRLRHLTNRGNFSHNAMVMQKGSGEIVACNRPKTLKHPQDFTHCSHCHGLYSRKSLWRHVKICPQKPEQVAKTGRKRVASQSCFQCPSEVSEGLWKIVCEMSQDEISAAVRQDKYIILFGEQMYNRLKSNPGKNEYIRQKMREIARLLLKAKQLTPLSCMEDFIKPSNFPHVIAAVRAVAGYDEHGNTYKIPSLALKLGNSLMRISSCVECSALISGQEQAAKSAQSFRRLYEARWNEVVSSSALNTLTEAKWNKPQVLPFTEDVKNLHTFLTNEQRNAKSTLLAEPNAKRYATLCKLTLSQVILFNRRREGEVSKMPLKNYISRVKTQLQQDIALGLSEFEKKLCSHFERVEIRGKRGRKVPVLLTPDMVSSLDALIRMRQEFVPAENGFLFARPNALTSYRGADCIREYANASGTKNPDAISSTQLRKQVATLSAVLNLKEHEMDQLASFMGHDIRVHRDFYRLPESTLQLAKMSKLLLAMEKGKLKEVHGLKLDDIVIDPMDEVDVSSDAEQNEEAISTNQEPSGCHQNLGKAERNDPLSQGQLKQVPRKKRTWSASEVQAIERHLMKFIRTCQLPGKKECVSCLLSEPVALQARDWTAVKFYIKNRITTLKRSQTK
ncbi:uncharacterized protein LOC143518327 [Brachyhypopomus gauderio]|uniref:uncharacterized protein LOC143513956 n=1 Tax=Brachyhypopomus gauderio TaxID=698409 RepID=UPI004041CB04